MCKQNQTSDPCTGWDAQGPPACRGIVLGQWSKDRKSSLATAAHENPSDQCQHSCHCITHIGQSNLHTTNNNNNLYVISTRQQIRTMTLGLPLSVTKVVWCIYIYCAKEKQRDRLPVTSKVKTTHPLTTRQPSAPRQDKMAGLWQEGGNGAHISCSDAFVGSPLLRSQSPETAFLFQIGFCSRSMSCFWPLPPASRLPQFFFENHLELPPVRSLVPEPMVAL